MPLGHELAVDSLQHIFEVPEQLFVLSILPEQEAMVLHCAASQAPPVTFGTQHLFNKVFDSQDVPLLADASNFAVSVQKRPAVHSPPIPSQLSVAPCVGKGAEKNPTEIRAINTHPNFVHIFILLTKISETYRLPI